MQRTALSYLLVGVLVVCAGCNAFTNGSDTSTDTPMVTPMDVPTDQPTPTVAPTATSTATPAPSLTPIETRRLPRQCTPGLTQPGFANASMLATAHDAALGNTSLTVRAGGTRIARNGSILSRTHTTVSIAQNYSRLYFISESVGPRHPPVHYTRFERWTNGERVLTREIGGHTPRYRARPLPPSERGHFTSLARAYANLPDDVLDNATACVTDQFTHNGTSVSAIAFTSARQPTWFVGPNATVLGNVTGRALVGSSGIVSEIRWNYRVRTADGAVVTVTKSNYFTDIGSTTVDRPLWYEKAVNQTQTTNRTTTA